MAELVSKRYAEALFEVVLENNNDEPVKEELQFVVDCLKDEPQLYQLLKSPLITVEEKKEILSSIFKGRVSQEVFNFLRIIVDKRRESYIESIVEEYRILTDKKQNKVEAVAVTAVPMGGAELLKLQEKLFMSSGKNIQLKNEVDPEIIGGVLIKMGDQIIDGTIKKRLDDMKEQLSQILV